MPPVVDAQLLAFEFMKGFMPNAAKEQMVQLKLYQEQLC